jgi:uncharacterized membrane protein YphA (DoxX/SURF4 family)
MRIFYVFMDESATIITMFSFPLFSMKSCSCSPCKWCAKHFKNEYAFGATVLRLTFGLLFLFVGIKKLRMGYTGFADGLIAADTNLANDLPAIVLYGYGLLLPVAEILAGLLLLARKHVYFAYTLVAVMYLTFVFGQMYNGNTPKIGTEYIPALLAVSVAYFFEKKS